MDMTAAAVAAAPTRATPRATRLEGVDALRAIAFVAVVTLHSLNDTAGHLGLEVANNATRFAVPFFFLASGYFLSPTAPAGRLIWRVTLRLAPVFFVWLAVYMFAAGDLATFRNPVKLSHYLLAGGPGPHLWFLPALGLGITIVALCRRSELLLIGLVVLFFVASLAFGPYRELLHLPESPIGPRNGPMLSVPFVGLGYLIARRQLRPGVLAGLALTIGGLALQLTESFGLERITGGFLNADSYVGTLPFAVGVFFLSLRATEGSVTRGLAMIGRITLWMYCVHLLFVWGFDRMLGDVAFRPIPLTLLAVGASLLSAIAASGLSRWVPWLDRFVR
jgi:surface polysaccharide O-acyltransferase-like enzyme